MGVDDSFRPSVVALGEADRALVGVVLHVDSTRARMLRAGLHGVARSLDAVKAEAERLRAEIASFSKEVTALQRRAAPITDETIPTDVISGLTPVLQGAQHGRSRVLSLLNGLHRLSELTFRALKGGSPGGLLARIEAVRTSVQKAGRGLNAAVDAAESAIQRARDSGVGSGGGIPAGLPHETESGARTSTVEPAPSERAGSRTVDEEPELSEAASYRRNMVRKAGDANSAIKNVTSIVREGWGLKPTGQHVSRPHDGPVVGPTHAIAPWGDILTGVAALGAMIGEIVRLSRRKGKK